MCRLPPYRNLPVKSQPGTLRIRRRCRQMLNRTRLFFMLVCLAGLGTLFSVDWTFHVDNQPQFWSYLALALLASRLKVKLTATSRTISANFIFILLGSLDLTFTQTLVIGCCSILMQHANRGETWPKAQTVLFDVSIGAAAIWAAYFVYNGPLHPRMEGLASLLLMMAAVTYFFVSTIAAAGMHSLVEIKPLVRTWRENSFWSFPYYLVSAAVA